MRMWKWRLHFGVLRFPCIYMYRNWNSTKQNTNMIYLHVGFHIDFLYNSQAHSGNTNDVPTGLHPGPWRSSLRHSDSCLVPSFAMFRVSRIGRICSKWSHENNPLLVGGFNPTHLKKICSSKWVHLPQFSGWTQKIVETTIQSYFPLYCLLNRDPYNGVLQSSSEQALAGFVQKRG